MKRCPSCQGRIEVRAVERTRHVDGYTFTTQLPGWVCQECGETYFADADVDRFDQRVALLLADAGLTQPEVLRYLRKAMGLQGKELAALLGVRPQSVSRWEQGKSKIDPSVYRLLRLLLLEQRKGVSEIADYLKQPKKKLPKRTKLDAA